MLDAVEQDGTGTVVVPGGGPAAPAGPTGPAEPTEPAEATGPAAKRRSGTLRRLTNAVLWAVVIGSIVLFHDQLPSATTIWASVRGADPAWLLIVIAAEAMSMGAFARLQRRLLVAGGVSISRRRVFAVTYASNALSTTLPAGSAISVVYSFREFRRSGSSAPLATAVILIGGVVTSTAYTLIALLALLSEPELRPLVLWGLAGVLAVVALIAVAATARPGAALRRLATRQPKLLTLAAQLRDGRRVLRLGGVGWGAVATLALLNWLSDILALIAATLAVGIHVAPYQVMVAYFAAQAAGSLLPLLPGGLGAIESSMVASLAAFGVAAGPAGAAVGVYRVVSYWAVVAVGWVAWAALRDPARAAGGMRRVGRAAADALRAAGSAFASACFSAPYTAAISPSGNAPASSTPAE